MTITTLAVGAAVAPTVVRTYISHYTRRKERHEKPTAHISYDEGLNLIQTFLKYASHHTVEDLQSFTGHGVPSPSWVRTENVTIPDDYISKAIHAITEQLGPTGIEQVGGTGWWQWRQRGGELKAEWIEMRSHYNEQQKQGSRSRRIMLYVHGGGYFFGSVDEHRYQMQRHARKLKARVFAPRYRLSPQFPFPCGLQDCLAAYLYLLSIHDTTEIILAGDSAGGGMVVSLLCLIRDQSLPLPAGAILISPWVDLSHSFPSLGGKAEQDYIPPYGFMQKPSPAWPPPNEEEFVTIHRLAKVSSPKLHNENDTTTTVSANNGGDVQSNSYSPLSIELDGKRVIIKDQIQMYAPNHLLAHPLVSPVMQPSLGGLPPILVLTGGGEILRDEQIYLAHKMAHPAKYPLGAAYRSKYDPDDKILHSYKPTSVQLQVWEDLCHVAPTLSFTRPAKYMYRSIAQFGAWVLAKAQKRTIEIVDDDDISIISSQTDTESETDTKAASSTDSIARAKLDANKIIGSVGRAGDSLPPFENNMIRQRVDRYGRIYPLAEPHDLPGLQMHPDEVGVIKQGPVRKWLAAKNHWDTKYAGTGRRVQKQRVRALASGKVIGFDAGEHPPPSALAGRRTDKDIVARTKKSYGLAMWSMWGSKHDETTLRREEDAVEAERSREQPSTRAAEEAVEDQPNTTDNVVGTALASPTSPRPARSRVQSMSSRRRASESRNPGRKRTVSVTDRGQAEGRFAPPVVPPLKTAMSAQSPEAMKNGISPLEKSATSPNLSLLSAGFIPKFRTASHLRDDSGGTFAQMQSDAASTMTGRSGVLPDDVSTRAVFAAPGVMKGIDGPEQGKETASTTIGRPQNLLVDEVRSIVSNGDDFDDGAASIAPSAVSRPYASIAGFGSDTPRSQRSLDRLQSHQQDDEMGRMAPLRSPSTTAIIRAEGVVGAVDGAADDAGIDPGTSSTALDSAEPSAEIDHVGDKTRAKKEEEIGLAGSVAERPGMYDRTETAFQTAVEKMS